MIHVAIEHISDQLNQHLRRQFGVQEDLVATSGFAELDGSTSPLINNRLVVSLVKIDRDTAPQPRPNATPGRPVQVKTVPPLFLNLFLMMAGNFSGKNYGQSLKLLSATIAFFQRRPVFDHTTSPELHGDIERLVLEIENLPFAELSHLWSILGGKVLPSVLYRVRVIAVGGDDLVGQVPTVSQPESRMAGSVPFDERSADRARRQRQQNGDDGGET